MVKSTILSFIHSFIHSSQEIFIVSGWHFAVQPAAKTTVKNTQLKSDDGIHNNMGDMGQRHGTTVYMGGISGVTLRILLDISRLRIKGEV